MSAETRQHVERHLAVILMAYVVGSARLMGIDEKGTLARLNAHLRQLFNPKISEHHGRLVKNTGDGVLVEFGSVVDAVSCAVQIQRAMIDRESAMAEDRRIWFRVGINPGDIVVEDDDILGDGVNVAARLEGLAEPGGICISGTVRDQVGNNLDYPFEDMGEQSVKNIRRPVRTYAISAAAVAATPLVPLRPLPESFHGARSGRASPRRSSSDWWLGGYGRLVECGTKQKRCGRAKSRKTSASRSGTPSKSRDRSGWNG